MAWRSSLGPSYSRCSRSNRVAMAIIQEDLIVLVIAMIQKEGILDTMQIEGKYLEQAKDRIEAEGGKVSLAFTGDPQGKYINITCLFSDEQREEWVRLGMTSQKIGEA